MRSGKISPPSCRLLLLATTIMCEMKQDGRKHQFLSWLFSDELVQLTKKVY